MNDANEKAANAVRNIGVWLATGTDGDRSVTAIKNRLCALVWTLTPEHTKSNTLGGFARLGGVKSSVLELRVAELAALLPQIGEIPAERSGPLEHCEVPLHLGDREPPRAADLRPADRPFAE